MLPLYLVKSKSFSTLICICFRFFKLPQKKTNCNPLAHPTWKCHHTNLWNAKLFHLTEGLLRSFKRRHMIQLHLVVMNMQQTCVLLISSTPSRQHEHLPSISSLKYSWIDIHRRYTHSGTGTKWDRCNLREYLPNHDFHLCESRCFFNYQLAFSLSRKPVVSIDMSGLAELIRHCQHSTAVT